MSSNEHDPRAHHVDASPLAERIAGAPVSWGISEVPGWGWQYDTATVLAQMAELGLAATELGPKGFLPDAPEDKAATLSAAGLSAVGQFVPVVLHDTEHDPLTEAEQALDALHAAGATTLVLAAATGRDGYDVRPDLDESGWQTMLTNLDRLAGAARERGLVATVHPHVGTMVDSGEATQRVIDGSDIGLCLDTGHLLIGGGDPVALAQGHPDRIAHVHLKDVRSDVATRVRTGELTYVDGIRQGLFTPLGAGDIDVVAIVGALEDAGYDGWYVLEQDAVLDGDPGATEGRRTPRADVEESLDFLLGLAAQWSGVGI